MADETLLPTDDDSGLQYVVVNGERRLLASLPTDPAKRMAFPRFGGSVPASEWRDIDRRMTFLADLILDQKSHGSCVGFATAAALMRAILLSGGKCPKLSGAYVYSFINGGRDQGAQIGDALAVIRDQGSPPETLCGWDAIYPNRISEEARAAAKKFRALELYRAETFADVASAVVLGCIPIFAVQVGRNFTNLNSQGVCGFDGGPGNHAVHADGLKKLSSGWVLDMVNSWSTQFGQQGRAYVTERHLDGIGYQDVFVVRAAAETGDTGDDPPTGK